MWLMLEEFFAEWELILGSMASGATLVSVLWKWGWRLFNAVRGISVDIHHSGQKGIGIDTQLERGPISREYGFTETGVKVVLMNRTGQRMTIKDVRLMFSHTHGLPVPIEAPKPRSHPTLPADIEPESAATWYFGAEKVATFFQMVLDPAAKTDTVRVHPQFTTVAGRRFRGPWIRLSTDVNAYWP